MKYEDLTEDLRKRLDEERFAVVRYGSLHGQSSVVDDAVLLKRGSSIDVDRLSGYTISASPKAWFEYVTAPIVLPEDCVRLVENALLASS